MWWRFGQIRSVWTAVPILGFGCELTTLRGHCLGDETVQCCHDQLTYTSSTTYNSPDYNTGGQDTQAVQPVDEGNGRIGIIVPTTTSPTSASDRDSKSIEVPAVREGKSENRTPPTQTQIVLTTDQGVHPQVRPRKRVRPSTMASNLTTLTLYQLYPEQLRLRRRR